MLPSTLTDLAGTWTGAETLSPSPWSPGGTARGRHTFTPALDGTALLHDYTQERDGAVTLSGHGVWLADADGSLAWFWFDSYGFVPPGPARGATPAAMEKTTPRGTQRARFDVVDSDTLAHAITVRLADARDFAPVAEARYARV